MVGERQRGTRRARAAMAVVCASALVASGCHVGLVGAAIGSAGANGPYQAASLASILDPKAVRTLGCLDLGLDVFDADVGPIVDVYLGNRCGHPEALDLRELVIRGTRAAEPDSERRVTLRDPRGEIVRLSVGGSEAGRERIRIDNVGASDRLCFDVDRVAPDAPDSHPAPVCFDRDGHTWKAA